MVVAETSSLDFARQKINFFFIVDVDTLAKKLLPFLVLSSHFFLVSYTVKEFRSLIAIPILFVYIIVSSGLLKYFFSPSGTGQPMNGENISPPTGSALESAKLEGQRRKEGRKYAKDVIIQLLLLWLVVSICSINFANNHSSLYQFMDQNDELKFPNSKTINNIMYAYIKSLLILTKQQPLSNLSFRNLIVFSASLLLVNHIYF